MIVADPLLPRPAGRCSTWKAVAPADDERIGDGGNPAEWWRENHRADDCGPASRYA